MQKDLDAPPVSVYVWPACATLRTLSVTIRRPWRLPYARDDRAPPRHVLVGRLGRARPGGGGAVLHAVVRVDSGPHAVRAGRGGRVRDDAQGRARRGRRVR